MDSLIKRNRIWIVWKIKSDTILFGGVGQKARYALNGGAKSINAKLRKKKTI